MGYYSEGENRTDHREGRKNRRGAYRQIAVTTVAAIAGSGITAGVLSYTWKPQTVVPAPAVVQTAAVSPSTSAVQGVSTAISDPQSQIITNIFKKVEPSVVAVVNYQNVSDFFSQQTSLQEYGVGSGVVFDTDSRYAYIVTNNHVVEGAAKLEVVLDTGKHIQATLVGADPYTDLAVIKVAKSSVPNLTVATFTDSSKIQVGQLAVAIGTPMGLDFADTVTSGIISGKQRMMPVEEPQTQQVLDYQSVIQTDAAINPGNSGGPLLDANGDVVGINSSKISATGFEGMGFAIPSNEVKSIVQQIMTTGHVQHPALGITAYSLDTVPQQYWPNTPVNYGVYVYSVDTAAAKASGLKAGDVIVALNGKTVQDEADLRTALFNVKPGAIAKLTVYRNSSKLTLSIKVGTLSSVPTGLPTSSRSANAIGPSNNANQQSASGLFGSGPSGW